MSVDLDSPGDCAQWARLLEAATKERNALRREVACLSADLEQSKARHKMCQESLATAAAERDALMVEVERLRLAADMLREIPRAALSSDKVYREDWEELFTDEDGAALYLDTAVDRVLNRITRKEPK